IDRELAGTEMLQIRRHLDGCPGCSAAYGALRRVKSLLAAAPPFEPSGDVTAAIMRRWGQRPQPTPLSPPRWPLDSHSEAFSAAARGRRYRLAFTSACLMVALAGTAMALHKPNYPDSVAASVLPSLLQPEERLPPPGPLVGSMEPWTRDGEWRRIAPPSRF